MAYGDFEDVRPRHEQIAAELRAKIMSGDLASGSQLDGLKKLAKDLKTSVPTMQRVIALLKQEGFLDVFAGKHTTIRQQQPIKISAASWIPLAEDGYTYTGVAVGDDRPPADVAAVLALDKGEPAFFRSRVLLYKGIPAEASWAYYRRSFAHGTELTYPKKIKGGVPRVFAELGLPYSNPEDTLSWREPTSTEMELLRMPPHVPVLRTLRVFRSPDGTPIEVSVLVKPGHMYQMSYTVHEP